MKNKLILALAAAGVIALFPRPGFAEATVVSRRLQQMQAYIQSAIKEIKNADLAAKEWIADTAATTSNIIYQDNSARDLQGCNKDFQDTVRQQEELLRRTLTSYPQGEYMTLAGDFLSGYAKELYWQKKAESTFPRRLNSAGLWYEVPREWREAARMCAAQQRLRNLNIASAAAKYLESASKAIYGRYAASSDYKACEKAVVWALGVKRTFAKTNIDRETKRQARDTALYQAYVDFSAAARKAFRSRIEYSAAPLEESPMYYDYWLRRIQYYDWFSTAFIRQCAVFNFVCEKGFVMNSKSPADRELYQTSFNGLLATDNATRYSVDEGMVRKHMRENIECYMAYKKEQCVMGIAQIAEIMTRKHMKYYEAYNAQYESYKPAQRAFISSLNAALNSARDYFPFKGRYVSNEAGSGPSPGDSFYPYYWIGRESGGPAFYEKQLLAKIKSKYNFDTLATPSAVWKLTLELWEITGYVPTTLLEPEKAHWVCYPQELGPYDEALYFDGKELGNGKTITVYPPNKSSMAVEVFAEHKGRTIKASTVICGSSA
jgi:hypothetical protein